MQKENDKLKEELQNEKKKNEKLKVRVSILDGRFEYLNNMVNIVVKSVGRDESEKGTRGEDRVRESEKGKSFGWKDDEARIRWRNDVKMRERMMLIVYKGVRYGRYKLKVAEWILEAIGKENREKVKLVRKEEKFWWIILESEELKKKVMEKWRIDKIVEWFVLEDVLSEEERIIRGIMERELRGMGMKDSKVERYKDSVIIDGRTFVVNKENNEVEEMKMQEDSSKDGENAKEEDGEASDEDDDKFSLFD